MNHSLPLPEMTCRAALDFLLDYVEDRLSPQQKEILEAHLAICPDCQSYLASYRQTIMLGKEALDQNPSIEELRSIPEELIKAILDARRQSD